MRKSFRRKGYWEGRKNSVQHTMRDGTPDSRVSQPLGPWRARWPTGKTQFSILESNRENVSHRKHEEQKISKICSESAPDCPWVHRGIAPAKIQLVQTPQDRKALWFIPERKTVWGTAGWKTPRFPSAFHHGRTFPTHRDKYSHST